MPERMMDYGMPAFGMMGILWFLLVIVLVLAAAALLKYLMKG